jgi:cysteine desulfurase
MPESIYLDYNATTPVDPEVVATMLPFFTATFGNAASRTHQKGWEAAAAVDLARNQVAQLLGCSDQEIIFTSGATEALNIAIRGVYAAYGKARQHIIVAATEHKAVLDTCLDLEKQGAEITILPVDREGRIDPDHLHAALRPTTALVCIMLANNETGTVQQIRPLADLTHTAGALLLSDTTQVFGKIAVDVDELGIDLCCVSAHKLYGPKGAGALYARRKNPRVSLTAIYTGGGHERGLRPGTLNVSGIVGLGKACELAQQNTWDDAARISSLRTRFEQILTELSDVFVNGDIRNRLPNTTSLTFTGIHADQLITRLPHLAMATGSACTSALPEPSHVLLAMGLDHAAALGSIRISLGRYSPEQETLQAAHAIAEAVSDLRRNRSGIV